jgi:membrane-associated protein
MLDVNQLIASGGVLMVAAIVFAESGMLIGLVLPGDTLLLAAGVLASQGQLPIIPLIIAVSIAGVLGDNVNYSIGRATGPRLFTKKDGLIFRQEYVQKASQYYEKHGGKTVLLARFLPVIRTFVPMVAGVGKMPRRTFMVYNVVGAIIWGSTITMLGYWFGSAIPNLDEYLSYFLLAMIVFTLGSVAYHILKNAKLRRAILVKLRRILQRLSLNRRID